MSKYISSLTGEKSPCPAGSLKSRRFKDTDNGAIESRAVAQSEVQLPIHRGTEKYPFEWAAIFLPAFMRILSADLTKNEMRVLLVMLAHMRRKNVIDLPHRLIAEEAGIHRPNATKAINSLVTKGMIEAIEDKNDLGRSMYRLASIIGWRGSAKEWHKHRNYSNVYHVDFGTGGRCK